ncbi:MAG: TetR/AcrR family transcriptional regulator [Proteobacteria bacterium]|nr:MAG: TetR/AcrR family transcriptional regulator [Pseudomonadota bacterium]
MIQQARAEDKYRRLVNAGAKMIHRLGFHRTKLSVVANEAGVPPGGLYYYFKTREELAHAVVRERAERIRKLTKKLSESRDSKKRLMALVDVWVDDRETDSLYGCPIGSLCYELAKGRTDLGRLAEEPFRVLLEWTEEQFRTLEDSSRRARDLAVHLVSALQGISLVANVFGDPKMILREARHLKDWIGGL